jgi:hypothetical protein
VSHADVFNGTFAFFLVRWRVTEAPVFLLLFY